MKDHVYLLGAIGIVLLLVAASVLWGCDSPLKNCTQSCGPGAYPVLCERTQVICGQLCAAPVPSAPGSQSKASDP